MRGRSSRVLPRRHCGARRSQEVDRLLKPFEQAQKLGDSFEVAVKNSLMATLCAKGFLYLEEGESRKVVAKLNDSETASRLSYFLWNSMPDARLLDLARVGACMRPKRCAWRSAGCSPIRRRQRLPKVSRASGCSFARSACSRRTRRFTRTTTRVLRAEHGCRDDRLFWRSSEAQRQPRRVLEFRLDARE